MTNDLFHDDAKDLEIAALKRQIEILKAQYPDDNPKTWAYYQQLKHDNPDLYWKRSTQEQMFKDAQAQFDAYDSPFADGDWSDTKFKDMNVGVHISARKRSSN